MAQITFKGSPVHTVGELPAVGSEAPDFRLVGTDLAELGPQDVDGKRVILNIFPSVDTGVCAASVRTFNQHATELPDTVVICASMDLPFAHKRFCGAEGIEGVLSASAFRNPEFGRAYGVTMTDGPLAGLFARAVVVLDTDGRVLHSQLVPEIAEEPDYDAALTAVRG